jgi:hypothetical protein
LSLTFVFAFPLQTPTNKMNVHIISILKHKMLIHRGVTLKWHCYATHNHMLVQTMHTYVPSPKSDSLTFYICGSHIVT